LQQAESLPGRAPPRLVSGDVTHCHCNAPTRTNAINKTTALLTNCGTQGGIPCMHLSTASVVASMAASTQIHTLPNRGHIAAFLSHRTARTAAHYSGCRQVVLLTKEKKERTGPFSQLPARYWAAPPVVPDCITAVRGVAAYRSGVALLRLLGGESDNSEVCGKIEGRGEERREEGRRGERRREEWPR